MSTALVEAESRASAAAATQAVPHFGPKAGAHAPGDARQRSNDIQQLIEQARTLPDPAARALIQQCLQTVLALYGDGLARIMQLLDNAGAEAAPARQALLRDGLVRSLLLIHGLHPESLEARVRAALDKIRPYLQSHGGNVELIGLDNDVARLWLQGTCKTCPSSSATLELAVRQSVEEACPDLMGFEVEGVPSAPNAGPRLPPEAPRWLVVEALGPLPEGGLRAVEVAGVPVLICKAGGFLYAYRGQCPACQQRLSEGSLAEEILGCRAGHHFDVHHAGKGCDSLEVHLDPLPLLAQGEVVKISVR